MDVSEKAEARLLRCRAASGQRAISNLTDGVTQGGLVLRVRLIKRDGLSSPQLGGKGGVVPRHGFPSPPLRSGRE
jgi:hypothetical protein